MRTSSPPTVARQDRRLTISARLWFCLALLAFAALTANAQTIITPPTATVQIAGQPNPEGVLSPITGPLGSMVLYGTGSVSPVTGQPYRHLWVDDANFGICRLDPDLDSPGPYAININTCPFKVNGASITGGPMSYDPGRKFLYFVDEQRASQGIIRIGFLPDADGGHGLLDYSSIFSMGGNTTGARFGGGQTGCQLPGNPGIPASADLDPLGNLWVGFKKSPIILRFNSPGTASSTGFGTCSTFIQTVATAFDGKLTAGIAWIGHDMWGADGAGLFTIPNADTTCLVPPNPACTPGNGTVVRAVPAIGTLNTIRSDQFYPATNGNNIFGTTPPPADVVWVGNVAGGLAGQTVDLDFYGIISPPPNPAIVGLNAVGVDATDPANLVAYSGDDYSLAVVPGQGQWFQSCQGQPPVLPNPLVLPIPYPVNCLTPAATAAPGAPLNVVAVAGPSQATVSWNPAQVNQPVTSYTVHNSFASNNLPVADVVVTPVAGSNFPPTSVVIGGLDNSGLVGYAFEVSASNAAGTSALSAQSNIVFPPGIVPPPAPTNVQAIAGDTQASVTWTVPNGNGGSPITSYTVTALIGGIPAGISVTVPPPPAGSNTGRALVGGLTNGTTYTFTVHASNIAIGTPNESAPSNPVTPSAANIPVLGFTMTGPTSVSITPTQVTYNITISNPITATQAFPVYNVSFTHTLTPIPAQIASPLVPGVVRGADGFVTVTTTTTHGLNIGQTVTIDGVIDPSFNGTFVIADVPTTNSFTYAQAGLVAASGSGTVTGLPLSNIQVAQASQGSCTSGGTGVITLTCSGISLDPGTSATISVIVQVQNQAIINTGTVTGTDFAGTLLAPVTASVTTTVPLPATQGGTTTDLQLSGSAKNGGPTVTGTLPTGAPDSYTWQIKDATSTAANNVVFTQTMPAALVFQSVTTDLPIDLGSCGGPAPGTAGGTVICTASNLNGIRKNGAKPVQQFTVTVNVNVVQTGTISTTGTVTFDGTDTNPGNNTVTVVIKAK